MSICIYPGSFDPITVGHVDIIRRSAQIFDEVVVGILHNPKKTGCFPIRDRIRLIEKACADIPGIRVAAFDGLLVDFAKQEGASVVIRGLRAVSDFESEFQMAQVNHHIQPDVETLFMMTQPQFAYISSSIVRELAHFGGDYQSFIPPAIQEDVKKLFQKI